MKQFTEIYDLIINKSNSLEFMPTGFNKLDGLLDGGFMRKELVVVGGATGIGKSYLSGQLMWNIARSGFKSAYFSLEISSEMLVSRVMGALANAKSTHIITGQAHEWNPIGVEDARVKMSTYENMMHFYDTVYELQDMESAIKQNQYDFVVIDFIQNIISNKSEEYDRLTHASLTLQKVAKDSNCCILCLSQLSNQMVRENGRGIVEFKGSGAIAMVADLAFFITRDYQLTPDRMKLNLRKNRRGISGTETELKFAFPGGLISEL